MIVVNDVYELMFEFANLYMSISHGTDFDNSGENHANSSMF